MNTEVKEVKVGEEILNALIGVCEKARQNGYEQGYKDGFQKCVEECDKGYEKGLNDAWEFARKIVFTPSTNEEMNDVFGDDFYYNNLSLFEKYSVSEVMTKVKEYEKRQAEIESKEIWNR